MSADVDVVNTLLSANSGLIAVVPAARILTSFIPEGTHLPSICVTHVSTMRAHMVAATAAEVCTSRVQVTVQAESYAKQQTVMGLIRTALPRSRGTTAGVAVESILSDIEGPDFRDDEAGIFFGSLDFIVTYSG